MTQGRYIVNMSGEAETMKVEMVNDSVILNITESMSTKGGALIWTPDVIQRVASLACIMILSFLGNTIIIAVLSCTRFRKRSRVNMFIINLAIGDLAVCFVTMTTEILFVVFGEWVLGPVACKLLTYVQIVTLASTTFILTSMGFDRYNAICRPLHFRSSVSRAKKMVTLSWFMSFVFALPQLFIFVQTVDEVLPDGRIRYGCRSKGYTADWQRKLYISFMTFYILILPAVLISYFYIHVAIVVIQQSRIVSQNEVGLLRKSFSNTSGILRAKVKTIKMTLAIIVLFITCWSPYFITTLIKVYSDYKYPIPSSLMAFSETVALLQSALNPILYGCFNFPLKRGFTDVCCHRRYDMDSIRLNNQRPSACLTLSGEVKYSRSCDSKTVERESSSSAGSSQGKTTRCHGCVIAESNKHGFKLRVRFTTNRNDSHQSEASLNHPQYQDLN